MRARLDRAVAAMRDPIVFTGKTTFSMAQGRGQWSGKWVITGSKTGRPHLVLDSEIEADQAMDDIRAAARIEADLRKERGIENA